VLRFAQAYREAVSWIFADPQAIKLYATQRGVPEALVKRTADEFQTKDGMQFDRILGLDAMMADGVKLKFLDAPLTQEQLAQLIQIPPP
jgi:NitT/TauT family transport system substrate-binding protein